MRLHPRPLLNAHAAAFLHLARRWLPLFLLALVVLVFMPTDHAFASATSGGGLPYETWLGTLRNSITGPVAFTVAIVALVGTGSALIFQGGEMNTFLRSTIYFILVIALVISAQNIMSGLFGKGAVVAQAVLEPPVIALSITGSQPHARSCFEDV